MLAPTFPSVTALILVAVNEANEQIEESKRHAMEFRELLKKAEKRFAALRGVEQRHAEAYKKVLEKLNG